jgi:hypothetical protein
MGGGRETGWARGAEDGCSTCGKGRRRPGGGKARRQSRGEAKSVRNEYTYHSVRYEKSIIVWGMNTSTIQVELQGPRASSSKSPNVSD